MLILGAKEIFSLKSLSKHAEKNIYSIDDMLDRINKAIPTPGDLDEFTVYIPSGFKIVFTIEEHPCGICRHLSVSVKRKGKLPSTISVQEIMKFIGFENNLENCHVSLETFAENHQAVNIIEKI